MDPVDQVVMTETQKELLNEIQDQYERNKKKTSNLGKNHSTLSGRMICHIPYDLLREAFEGQPPTK